MAGIQSIPAMFIHFMPYLLKKGADLITEQEIKILMRLTTYLILLLITLSSTSCINTRKATYFVDQKDTTIISNNTPQQSVIAPNDLLSIYVTTSNPASAAVFNAPNQTTTVTNSATGNQIQISGFLVDPDGNIQYPIIGNVKAKGLTTMQLKDYITRTLTERKLLVDFLITVRQLNFKVSVLGEVAKPTVINVTNEQITLLEALGLAGDITIYGRKDHVMIIRQENEKKTIAHIDLNSNQLFNSPYYYLKSKDVVYVETGKSRVFGTSSTSQILPIVLGVLSLAAIIITNVTN